MSWRRREAGGSARKPTGPAKRQPRRRRSLMSRASTRGAALTTVLATSVLAIGGVAIAGAIGSGGGGTKPVAAGTPSASVPVAPPTPTPTPSRSLAPVPPSAAPTHSSAPKPAPVGHSSAASPTSAPVRSASPAATRSPCASAPAQRVAAARRLLQHQDALPQVTLVTAGPRQGLLGDSDASARTLTLYVRSCGEEPTIQLASVWGYEAGQFIPVQLWDSAKQSKWEQLRGSGSLSYTQTKQDAASVYAFWQTRSTRYWQSPVAPPSFSQLSKLVPLLHMS
jgi:hypothetical protein